MIENGNDSNEHQFIPQVIIIDPTGPIGVVEHRFIHLVLETVTSDSRCVGLGSCTTETHCTPVRGLVQVVNVTTVFFR